MRLFIAVEISNEVREKISEVQKYLLCDEIKVVHPELIHITLKFLGEVDESKLDEIKTALSYITFQPIHLKCKGVGVFPNENFIRVIWAGVEGVSEGDMPRLKALADQVEKHMVALRFEKNEHNFSPHITIGRPKEQVDLSEFLKKYKNNNFGSFRVDNIKLKKSTLTPKGPIYEDI